MKSDLSIYYSTKISPNSNPRVNAKYNPTGQITKITIHHMATKGLSAMNCAASFHNPARKGSANYCIDDKEIVCAVPEERRAWTSDSQPNDYNAITIEVSNSTGAPDWKISDASYKNLIALCVDICKRYHITPTFTGDKNGTFTYHYFFVATLCPGPYIKSLTNQIIKDVKAGLGNNNNDKPSSDCNDHDKDNPAISSCLVKVTASDLNIRSGPGTKYKRVGHITDHGIYTIVEKSGNWGKLKSGAGWICLKYTKEVK